MGRNGRARHAVAAHKSTIVFVVFSRHVTGSLAAVALNESRYP